MPRFFRRLAEGVFDEEDLILQTKELNEFLDEAAQKYDLNEITFLQLAIQMGQISLQVYCFTPTSQEQYFPLFCKLVFLNLGQMAKINMEAPKDNSTI